MQGGLAFLGLGLIGYGGLVVIGVLPHDAATAGLIALILGAGLLALSHFLHRGNAPDPARTGGRRALAVGGLGAFIAAGVVTHEAVSGSGLGGPEWAMLAYGCGLLLAAPYLARRVGKGTIGDAVAWSFPLVLAPLAMFAFNALLSEDGRTAASPIVRALLVVPTGALLAAIGTDVVVQGSQLVLGTPRGDLVLGVGLVCAGIYPMVLFGGLVALHGWRGGHRLPRLGAYLAIGLVGLWIMNLLRLLLLAKIGQAKGALALQTAHAHLGWVLFAAFMVVFWAVVLRRVEAEPAPASTA